MSGAERQRRYRERRGAGEPVRRYVDVERRRRRMSRPQIWEDAVQTLIGLQAEYRDWFEQMPESLKMSATGEKLEAICDLDLDSLEMIDLPRGYGRD